MRITQQSVMCLLTLCLAAIPAFGAAGSKLTPRAAPPSPAVVAASNAYHFAIQQAGEAYYRTLSMADRTELAALHRAERMAVNADNDRTVLCFAGEILRLDARYEAHAASRSWQGLPPSPYPKITSVSPVRVARRQTIVIRGKGFGRMKAFVGDSPVFLFSDLTCDCNFGNDRWPFPEGGVNGTYIIISKWTDTKIKLLGFSNQWQPRYLAEGDRIEIVVWNAQTSRPGPARTTGPSRHVGAYWDGIHGRWVTRSPCAIAHGTVGGDTFTFTQFIPPHTGSSPLGGEARQCPGIVTAEKPYRLAVRQAEKTYHNAVLAADCAELAALHSAEQAAMEDGNAGEVVRIHGKILAVEARYKKHAAMHRLCGPGNMTVNAPNAVAGLRR